MSHLWSTNHVGQKRQRGWLLLLLRAPTQRHDVSAFFSCVCWFPAEVLCVCSHSGSGVKVNHIYLFTLKNLTVNIYTTTVKPSKTNSFFFSHFSFTTWVPEASLWFSAISLVQGWVKPALLLLLLLHKRKWSSVIGRYCPQTWKKNVSWRWWVLQQRQCVERRDVFITRCDAAFTSHHWEQRWPSEEQGLEPPPTVTPEHTPTSVCLYCQS